MTKYELDKAVEEYLYEDLEQNGKDSQWFQSVIESGIQDIINAGENCTDYRLIARELEAMEEENED